MALAGLFQQDVGDFKYVVFALAYMIIASGNKACLPDLHVPAANHTNTTGSDPSRIAGFGPRFARAMFVTARRSDGGPSHDATHDRVVARLGYQLRVPAKVPVTLAPSVGLHVMRFGLSGSDNGAPEPDLPDVAYVSLHLGADIEARLVDNATLLVSGAFLPVLSGGPILSPAFFPNGSARGITLEAGLRYAVNRRLSILLLGDYLAYSLSLDPSPAAVRVASVGRDAVIGIRTGVRAIF